MPLEISKVHHYVKQPGENVVKLVRTNPYIRFSHKDGGTIFLQGGHFWYEGGDLCSERPDWLLAELKKTSPAALKEAGFREQLEPTDLEVSKNGTQLGQPETRQPVVSRKPIVRRPSHGSADRG